MRVRGATRPLHETPEANHATTTAATAVPADQRARTDRVRLVAATLPADQSEQDATARSVRTDELHRSTTADSRTTAPMRVHTSSQLRDDRLTTISAPRPPIPTTPRTTAERREHSNR